MEEFNENKMRAGLYAQMLDGVARTKSVTAALLSMAELECMQRVGKNARRRTTLMGGEEFRLASATAHDGANNKIVMRLTPNTVQEFTFAEVDSVRDGELFSWRVGNDKTFHGYSSFLEYLLGKHDLSGAFGRESKTNHEFIEELIANERRKHAASHFSSNPDYGTW